MEPEKLSPRCDIRCQNRTPKFMPRNLGISDPSLAETDPLARVEHIERLAALMDSQFKLPGTNIGMGLDTIIGLVPVIGDTAGLGVSSYIIYRAYQLGLPKRTIIRMAANVGMDWIIGLIPVIGDIFDVGWKANNRNAALIRKHFERKIKTKP